MSISYRETSQSNASQWTVCLGMNISGHLALFPQPTLVFNSLFVRSSLPVLSPAFCHNFFVVWSYSPLKRSHKLRQTFMRTVLTGGGLVGCAKQEGITEPNTRCYRNSYWFQTQRKEGWTIDPEKESGCVREFSVWWEESTWSDQPSRKVVVHLRACSQRLLTYSFKGVRQEEDLFIWFWCSPFDLADCRMKHCFRVRELRNKYIMLESCLERRSFHSLDQRKQMLTW